MKMNRTSLPYIIESLRSIKCSKREMAKELTLFYLPNGLSGPIILDISYLECFIIWIVPNSLRFQIVKQSVPLSSVRF